MFLNYCPYGFLRLIDVNDESDHVLLQAHAMYVRDNVQWCIQSIVVQYVVYIQN